MEEQIRSYAVDEYKKDYTENKDLGFWDGLKSGTSIAIGYIPIAVTFGLLARSYGIPNRISMFMSFSVFAGASQFIAIQLINAGSSVWEIVITTFILNFRHFLMSSSLSQKIGNVSSKSSLYLLSFGVTDETFAMASLRKEEKLNSTFIIGLNVVAFSAWNIGTWIGIFAANELPQSIRTSMGIALYVMFIALLVPSLKSSRPVLIISSTAIVLHSLLRWLPFVNSIATGWTIIIATITSAIIGAIVFPLEVS
jgi:4-azaleucine resistance transporter AzlC